jgi:HD-GYP domain-containing protein (c-di-GMP phosphodiesterase class II)
LEKKLEKEEKHYRKIKVSTIQPGAKFNAPVYMDEDLVFVPANITVEKKDLERLKAWNVENVYTEGIRITEGDFRITDSNFKMEIPKIIRNRENSTNEKYCLDLYNDISKRLTVLFNNIKMNEYFDKNEFNDIVNALLVNIKKYKNELLNIVLFGGHGKDNLVIHSINCAIISIIIGHELKVTGYRMLDLIAGALLHDVGKSSIHESVLNKKDQLTELEKRMIRSHPVISYKIILKQLKLHMNQAQIGLYHHERWNGGGYPRGISGEKIPFLARIVTVADSYVALIHMRPYRNKHIGYNAVKVITGDNGKIYDPKITKSLLYAVGLHPIGSIVQLNNLYIGRVIENHKDAVLRPKIELIINNIGKKMSKSKIVNLYNNKELFITKAVDPATL